MRHGWRWLAVALGLLACVATAQATGDSGVADASAPGGTLDSLLTIARQNNPELSAVRYEAQAAIERVVPAGALMDPRLKVDLQDITKMGEQGANVLPSQVGATAYTLTQELPWSGKRDLKRDIATLDAEAAQVRARQNWVDLAARIKALFVQRYLVRANERIANETLELMLQQEKVMQVRYAGGLAAQQDITRIHVEHTAMRAELVALGAEWRQTQTRLNTLLARPAHAPLSEPLALRALPEAASLDFAALSERLRNANPSLSVAAFGVLSAEKTRDLTNKSRYPDFTLGINAMQRQNTFKEWGLMVELNLPIRDRVLQAQERESEALLAAAQSRQQAAANQALAELADTLIALDAARQTEHLMTYSLMPQADLTWRAALAAYENGKADFTTLLDAQRQIRQARQSQIKAQAEAQMRLIDIERLVGEEL
jgi:outer membrane protein TolC